LIRQEEERIKMKRITVMGLLVSAVAFAALLGACTSGNEPSTAGKSSKEQEMRNPSSQPGAMEKAPAGPSGASGASGATGDH
jgi:hypothetical protein